MGGKSLAWGRASVCVLTGSSTKGERNVKSGDKTTREKGPEACGLGTHPEELGEGAAPAGEGPPVRPEENQEGGECDGGSDGGSVAGEWHADAVRTLGG